MIVIKDVGEKMHVESMGEKKRIKNEILFLLTRQDCIVKDCIQILKDIGVDVDVKYYE